MALARISVNVDAETKHQAEELLNEMGLTMTVAINMYLKRIALERGIPFEVTTRVPNATTIEALNEYDQMRDDPESYKRYSSFRDVLNEVL